MKKELQITEKLENCAGNEEYSAERCINCLQNKLEHQEAIARELYEGTQQINRRGFIALIIALSIIAAVVFGFLIFQHGNVSTEITQTSDGENNTTLAKPINE